MHGTCDKGDTRQSCSCLNRFMPQNEDTGSPSAICQFCSRKQLLEQLRRANAECQQTVVCSNKYCNTAVPRSQLNKHRLNCMFSYVTCPHALCDFRGTRSETDVHAGNCEYRKTPCVSCGRRLALKDYKEHVIHCGALVQCDQCPLVVSTSARKTHEAWYCTRRSIRSFCHGCKTIFNYVDLEVHKRICDGRAESDTGHCTRFILPVRERNSKLPFIPDKDVNLPEIDDQSETRLLPTHNSESSATSISDKMIGNYSLVPGYTVDPLMRTSTGIQRRTVSVTPSARQRWRSLMNSIDKNMDISSRTVPIWESCLESTYR